MLCMLFDKDYYDIDMCIKMCLVHDFAESITGDFIPIDKVKGKNYLE